MRELFAAAAALVACALVLFPGPAAAKALPDASQGQAVFKQRCSLCHTPGKSRVGPDLIGVAGGRKARPQFNYSPAMAAQPLTWTPARLDAFLAGPQKAVPGSRMMVAVPQAADRAAVVAYLRGLK